MSDVEVQIIRGDSRRRKYSDFLCKELFYEHLEGKTGGIRQSSIERLIEGSADSKREHEQLHKGVRYVEQLGEIDIDARALKQLSDSRSYVSRFLARFRWQQWPAPLRWSLQSVAIAFVTAYSVIHLPWQKLPVVTQLISPQSVELVRLEGKDQGEGNFADHFLAAENTQPVAQQEILAKADPPKSQPVAPMVPTSSSANEKVADSGEGSTSVKSATESVVASSDTNQVSKDVSVIPPKKTSPPPLQGFVYRSYPLMSRLDEKAPLIIDKIKELGGQKAGQVELGWRRKNSRYFHFSLPEGKYPVLIGFLESFGKIKVVKDRHRRVMPAGVVRFILWIEEVPEKMPSPPVESPSQNVSAPSEETVVAPQTQNPVQENGVEEEAPTETPSIETTQ